jgi:hypothetical protein
MRTIKLTGSVLFVSTPFIHRITTGAVFFLIGAFLFAAHAAAADLTVVKAGTGSGSVTSSPPGINCGDDCAENYDSATSVQLTAVPAAGSDFSGWAQDCSGTTSCTVTMSASRTVRAVFSLTVAIPIGGPVTQVVCEFATGALAGQIAVMTVPPTPPPVLGQPCTHPQGSGQGSGTVIVIHTSLFQFVCKFDSGPLAGLYKVLTALTSPSIGAACSEGGSSGTVAWKPE